MDSPAPPGENLGGRRRCLGPHSLERPGQTSDYLGWEAPRQRVPQPRPQAPHSGHRNHNHCSGEGGGGRGAYTGAEAPKLMGGHRESTEEQGTDQGPGAGCGAALSPTLTTPPGCLGCPGGPQVGGPQAGVAGDAHPGPISPLQALAGEVSAPTLPGSREPETPPSQG